MFLPCKHICDLRSLLFSILLMLCSAACAGDAPVRVAVAANFHTTLQSLVHAYQQKSAQEIQLVAGSTGLLYQQIVHGAPFDLLFAADQERPERLFQRGLTVSNPRVYAHGQLAFLVSGEVKPTQQQLFTWRERVALANPALAPYGAAAQQVIEQRFTYADQVQRVLGNNVSQVMQYVTSGNIAAGFVSWAQLDPPQRQQALLIPQEWHQPIVQSAVLLNNGIALEQASAFLDFVTGEGRSIVITSGYRIGPIQAQPMDHAESHAGQLK